MSNGRTNIEMPSVEILEAELSKVQSRNRFRRALRNAFFLLATVATIATILAVLIMPVLRISGVSMSKTLEHGDITIAIKNKKYTTGDVIGFYYNNDILVKRVIALSGDWVDIDEDGNVYVNNALLDEPYVSRKALGVCNITFPYQVPDGRCFVMGDNRRTSIDSRNTAVGCISDEMVLGKLILRIWPLPAFGGIH